MDQVILAQKLESLRRCIQRVEEKTPTVTDICRYVCPMSPKTTIKQIDSAKSIIPEI
jgi:hypothetical protein